MNSFLQWLMGVVERMIYVLPAIIIALTFHEYAHARVAYAFGDSTAKDAGRLSLNPFRHLDLVGTLFLVFAGFGWAKPVPVNLYNIGGNRKKKMLAISVAGPIANLLQALLGMGLLALIIKFLLPLNNFEYWLLEFLSFFVQINIVLAVFNLIPIPPLDGSKILAGLLPNRFAKAIWALERYGFAILFCIVFLPNILSQFGLPRIDILGTIISRPAMWIMNGLASLFGIN